jgi:hypothetical protein
VRVIRQWLARLAWALVLLLSLGADDVRLEGSLEQTRRYTRQREFDFVRWTIDAAWFKAGYAGADVAGYLNGDHQRQVVLRALDQLASVQRAEAELERLISDPEVDLQDEAVRQAALAARRAREEWARGQGPAEAVLQAQVAQILAENGLGAGGAPFPPVAFHMSRLPLALIVSPRHEIRQEANIQIVPDMPLEEQIALERAVEAGLGVSALIVPIGGVGTYPTMVQETTSLDWLAEVIAHEWIHNYLTLRPLGLLYDHTPALRTMNETTATLMGKWIGRQVIERFYPEHLPAESPSPPPESQEPGFNFRREMHLTRLEVDRLLAEGRIETAEDYMEARRLFFREHGYALRRINQAYFAFHGAYADTPESAAGEDPVGAAVRILWERLDNPLAFLRRMAWMTDFSHLERALQSLPPPGRPIAGHLHPAR